PYMLLLKIGSRVLRLYIRQKQNILRPIYCSQSRSRPVLLRNRLASYAVLLPAHCYALTAQEHRDYSNLSLQHSIFPKGLKVVFIDEFKRENIITADYGTLYNSTSIIDLQGNVVLQTSDGGILKTPQLFWDAKTDWIFTEETFNFSNPEYDVVATRLDTNKEFTKFKTGKLTGTVAVQEDNNE
ncbi:MAG: LPS export ABC transporter periplasmic protein LptC, partial [Flavobacteriaceae bacterium]